MPSVRVVSDKFHYCLTSFLNIKVLPRITSRQYWLEAILLHYLGEGMYSLLLLTTAGTTVATLGTLATGTRSTLLVAFRLLNECAV